MGKMGGGRGSGRGRIVPRFPRRGGGGGRRDSSSRERQERIRILVRASEVTPGDRARELPIAELGDAIRNPELVAWVDIVHPQEGAARLLRDPLGLGPLTVEDCLTPQRMPKIDILPDGGVFLVAFATRLDEGGTETRLRMEEVDLHVGRRHLVTVRHGPVQELEGRLASIMGEGMPLPDHAGGALAHAVLDALVDAHLPVMVRAAAVAEELEDRLDLRSERSSLAAMEGLIVLRRDLLAFRRLAVAQGEVLRRLERAAPGVGTYLSDVADNQREAIELADATRDYIDGAIEAYRMRRDERSEAGIRRLTVLAGILGPLSLIAGLWGVNFQGIPGTESPLGWYVFVAVQIALTLLAVLYFRWRGLL